MKDLFNVESPPGVKYAWLDLKAREWEDIEFLPNGWERVPFDRHSNLCEPGPNRKFIELYGLTLCEQPAELEARKQQIISDYKTAKEAGDDFEAEMIEFQLKHGMPIS